MTQEEYIQRLVEISGKKLNLMQNLLSLTRQQTVAISDSDVDRLNDLIAKKQEIIEGVNKIDDEFNVYFQRLKQTLKINRIAELKDSKIQGVSDLQSVVERVLSLVKETSEAEKINSINGKKLLDKLSEEIKTIQQGKQTSAVYSNTHSMPPPSYFIDKKK